MMLIADSTLISLIWFVGIDEISDRVNYGLLPDLPYFIYLSYKNQEISESRIPADHSIPLLSRNASMRVMTPASFE
jgi:hypothetical protein